ncbi:MAG: tetratricopeptide repeat protein [Bacteroidota bacterium]|nr:tetratricopeptide repeat protein [Bacteroidota bacterium]
MPKEKFKTTLKSLLQESQNITPNQSQNIQTDILPILQQVAYSHATSLARSGKYFEAEILLKQVYSETETPSLLDFLARIYAQQGRFIEAERLWTKALILEPSNTRYIAALDQIAKKLSHPFWFSPILTLLLAIVAVFTVVILTFKFTEYLTDFRSLMIQTMHDIVSNNTVEQKNTSLQSSRISINISGIRCAHEGNQTVITFEEGLFTHGVKLKAQAFPILTSIGKLLDSHNGKLFLDITGFTDTIPVKPHSKYLDNTILGLQRAVAVVEQLRAVIHRPSSMFSVRSSGDINPPFPNDSPQNRSRNKTVVIRISEP